MIAADHRAPFLVGVVLVLAVVVLSGAAKCDDADVYLDLLRARDSTVDSYRCTVAFEHRDGPECGELADVELLWINYFKKHRPDLPTVNLQESVDRHRATASATHHQWFTYRWNRPALIRIEEFADESFGPEPKYITVFDGTNWASYAPLIKDLSGLPRPQLSIYEREHSGPWIEVARRAGIGLTGLLSVPDSGVELSRVAIAIEQVSWGELLTLIDHDSVVAGEEPPSGHEDSLPFVRFQTSATPVGPEFSAGASQFTVWFDPAESYAIRCVECSEVQLRGVEPGVEYVPAYRAFWSPASVNAAGAAECRITHFSQLQIPDESVDSSKWRTQAFASIVQTYRMTEIVENSGADLTGSGSDDFRITPAPGTNVIDEPQGIRYLVGNAGEILDQTALGYRNEIADAPPQGSDHWATWRIVVLGVNAVAVVALAAYAFWRRRRKIGGPAT